MIEENCSCGLLIKHINYISPQQHGCFKNRSMESSIFTFTDHLARVRDDNLQADVYTDFAKSFDKINHNCSLKNLQMLMYTA